MSIQLTPALRNKMLILLLWMCIVLKMTYTQVRFSASFPAHTFGYSFNCSKCSKVQINFTANTSPESWFQIWGYQLEMNLLGPPQAKSQTYKNRSFSVEFDPIFTYFRVYPIYLPQELTSYQIKMMRPIPNKTVSTLSQSGIIYKMFPNSYINLQSVSPQADKIRTVYLESEYLDATAFLTINETYCLQLSK